MKKSVVVKLSLVAAVGLGTLFGGVSIQTEAESINSLKKEQTKIQGERSDVTSDINQASNQITNLQNQQSDVKKEMKRLDYAISDTTAKMNAKTKKINETKEEIAKLQAETKVIQERIKKRNALLKDRVRSYQENGGMVDYIDVLMGAKSFSDFIDRANAVATIMQADQDILKKHEADKKELEEKQTQVENELSSLQKMLSDLETMSKTLSAQKAEKDQMLASLKAKEDEIHEGLMDLKEQEQLLAAQEAAIKKAIQLEKERQAQAAREAAERAKAQANSSSGNSSSGGTTSSSTPGVSSGYWTQPAVGYLSSGFGQRGSERHVGVDIANRTSVPILAAADGVVIRSYYSSSYGNCIFVSHSINGQVYTTVYAHMSSRLVGTGAVVSKGQQIGVMGNTGASTGQHLHFELHKGPWTADKRYAINPVGIVPLP